MTTRRTRRLTRRAAKPLLCVVLALATLVSPWESGLLPGPLKDLTGEPAASAQTTTTTTAPPTARTVIDGTPEQCPTSPPKLWSPQPTDTDNHKKPECRLELPACPESPLFSGEYMRLSVPPNGLAAEFPDLAALYTNAIEYPQIPDMDRYPEFCEERVLDVPPGNSTYSTCINITGYTVKQYTDPGGQDGCRIITPIACPAGLHRIGVAKCRAVHRRNWTCAAGYIPRNEFNSCYRAPTYSGATHPACGRGRPEFLAMDCAEYVGQDFIHNSASIDCADDYPTGTPAKHTDGTQAVSGAPKVTLGSNYKSGASSHHWCAFDTRYLVADCHRTDKSSPECSTASMALCLKRASATGGCNLTAAAIRCRALQAAHAQQPRATTIEEVREQGCAPCQILPFKSVPDADAEACQLTTKAPYLGQDPQRQILGVMDDFAIGATTRCKGVETPADLKGNASCRGVPVCADPPRGRIDWTSNHFSQLAVVNSPILVQILDIPLEDRILPQIYYDWYRGVVSENYLASHFVDASNDDPRSRTLEKINTSTSFTSVNQMIAYECRIRTDPYFEVIIEQLWPDSAGHRMVIEELFGTDALDWWNELNSTERDQRTLSRGLTLLSSSPTEAELKARADQLTTRIHCKLAGGRACRWLPARPGFYRLKGAGAWIQGRVSSRIWGSDHRTDYLDKLIGDLTNASKKDGPCHGPRRNLRNWGYNTRRWTDRDCILSDLRVAGIVDDAGIAVPSKVGLKDDLDDVLPNLESDALFNEEHAATAACWIFSRDFRVHCGGGYSVGNYTETEPIGIVVHEVRVSTVRPNN